MTYSLGLAIASCAAGFVASYFWYRSATVETVPTWAKGDGFDSLHEPAIKSQAQDGWIAGGMKAAMESSAWNRKAAIWSAVAVLLTGVASVMGALRL